MKILAHGVAFLGFAGYAAIGAVLLFPDGAHYASLLVLPIPLVCVLAWLARWVTVAPYVWLGAVASVLLVLGRWSVDSWLRVG